MISNAGNSLYTIVDGPKLGRRRKKAEWVQEKLTISRSINGGDIKEILKGLPDKDKGFAILRQ